MKRFMSLLALGMMTMMAMPYEILVPGHIGTTDVNYAIVEGLKASYRVQVADVTPAASATDVLTLCGSSTKTIRVDRVQATADATSPSVLDFYIYKRTTADTGGTSTNPTAAKFDSSDAAATAAITLYSSNPGSLGTGLLFSGDHYALPAASSTGYPGVPWVEDFGIRNNKAIVLHGTSECVAFGLNGQTIPAGTILYVGIEWTEE